MFDLRKQLALNNSVEKALMSVFGVGQKTSATLCRRFGICSTILIKTLSAEKLSLLKRYFARNVMKFGIQLRLAKEEIVRHLVLSKCYRGSRLRKGLPVRGQRSRSNARTQKKRKLNIV